MEYTRIEKDGFKVIGIRRIAPYGGGTWAIVNGDPLFGEKITALTGKFFDLGLCFGFHEDGSNDYMCAVEWDGEAEGFDRFTYPEATWLVFDAKGKISDGVLGKVWDYINSEFLPKSGLTKCTATIEKYILWDEAADTCHIEIHIPIELK